MRGVIPLPSHVAAGPVLKDIAQASVVVPHGPIIVLPPSLLPSLPSLPWPALHADTLLRREGRGGDRLERPSAHRIYAEGVHYAISQGRLVPSQSSLVMEGTFTESEALSMNLVRTRQEKGRGGGESQERY